eukprot:g5168.t1
MDSGLVEDLIRLNVKEGGDGGRNNMMSRKGMKELLEAIKKDKNPRSDLVLKYGTELLEKHGSYLGNNIWELYEDVAIAALNEGQNKRAEICINRLLKRFGDSSARVRRLHGMCEEARGNYDEAKKIYEAVLEKNPSNQLVKKRLVSIFWAQGKTEKAIEELVGHLKMCATDVFAWQQLAKMYVSVGAYEQAAFCYEELMTITPREPLYHTMYAELMYAVGRNDADSLREARRYFALSVDSKFRGTERNVRALVGMAMSAAALDAVKGKRKEGAETDDGVLNRKLHKFAAAHLKTVYDNSASPVSKYATLVLNEQSKALGA